MRRPVVLATATTLCVTLFAVLVRLAVLAEMKAGNPLYATPFLDEAAYIAAAQPGATASSLLSPLWPAVLRMLSVTTRDGAAHVNVALGAATAALTCVIALRISGSLVAAAIAGTLVAASGGLAFLDTTAQIEPLSTLLATVAVAGIVASARTPSLPRLVVAGGLVALAALARGTQAALLLGCVPAVFAAASAGDASTRPSLRVVATRTGAVLGAFVAATLLFHATIGAVPASAGVNVWLGNNAYSRNTLSFGTDLFGMDTVTEERETLRIASDSLGRPATAADANRYWTARAVGEVTDAPLAATAHLAKKALLVVSADEIGGVHDVIVERQFSWWTRNTPVTSWLFLAMGAAGFVLVRRRSVGARGAGAAAFGLLVACVIIFPLGRYRVAVVPTCAVLVGAGIAALMRRETTRRDTATAAMIFVLVSGASVAALSLRPPMRPESWTNLAVASRDGEAFLRRAVAEDPTYAPAQTLLGHQLLDRRENGEALRAFEAAATEHTHVQRPQVWRDAQVGRARALSNLGRHGDAMAAHEKALRTFPADAALAADGVLLALVAGNRADAARRLAHAQSLDPQNPAVLAAQAALAK